MKACFCQLTNNSIERLLMLVKVTTSITGVFYLLDNMYVIFSDF